MRWFDRAELETSFTPKRALEAVEEALRAIALGEATIAQRVVADVPEGASLLMTARLPGALTVKIVQVRPENAGRRLPRHPGIVLLFDPDTGLPRAGFDAEVITGRRTAAISAFAARAFAPHRPVVAVLGAGSQGFYQAEGLLALGGVEEIRLWNRTEAKARALSERLREIFPEISFRVAESVCEAARDADVVTAATASPEPLLALTDVKPGALVNAVGAYRPETRELSTDLVASATLFADTLEGCLAEAGDFLVPAREGALDLGRVRPLAEALNRERPHGTVVMKSVGSAAFDAASAKALCAP